MIYRSSYTRMIIHLLFVCLTCFAISWFALSRHEWIPAFLLLLLLVFQIIAAIQYLNIVNRKMSLFFASIINNDNTLNYPTQGYPESFHQLFLRLQEVNDHIREINLQNEIRNQFYQHINDTIATGIIAFDDEEHLHIFNKAASNMLQLERIHYLSHLKNVYPEFYDIIKRIQPDQQPGCKLWVNNRMIVLSIQMTILQVGQENIKIVSFQDIKNEMDTKEMEAWQKLIRVMAHEIMNSIAPVTSLSETLLNYYLKNNQAVKSEDITVKTISNTIEGLQAIGERSNELSKFIDRYRQLTNIPLLEIMEIPLKDLFSKLLTLIQPYLNGTKIIFQVEEVSAEIKLMADPGLIMQVILNLVKNSIESIDNEQHGKINLFVSHINNRVCICLKDSGKGIDPEILDNIFVPFFTTKKSGSGIGLSFSQQVMHLHGGKIIIESNQLTGTLAILQF